MLEKIAEKTGKRTQDIKTAYTKLSKTKIEEGLKDIIPEEQFEKIVILGLLGKYEISDMADELFGNGEVLLLEEDDDDVIEFNDIYEEPEEDVVEEQKTFKQLLKVLKSTDGEETQFPPSLQIKTNVNYRIFILDPEDEPYHHNGVNKWGKKYESYAFNIQLIKVKPKDFYDEIYEKGDFKGEPLYTNGRNYKLWLAKRHMESFVAFWRDALGLENVDQRSFEFRKTEKTSKTSGRTYAVFKFFEVK